jgi:hypothetical protein
MIINPGGSGGAGPWQVVPLGPKVEASAPEFTPEAREEPNGNVRLVGRYKAKEAVPANNTLGTLPAGLRPSVAVTFWGVQSGGSLFAATITVAGALSINSELAIGTYYSVSGITFNLLKG